MPISKMNEWNRNGRIVPIIRRSAPELVRNDMK